MLDGKGDESDPLRQLEAWGRKADGRVRRAAGRQRARHAVARAGRSVARGRDNPTLIHIRQSYDAGWPGPAWPIAGLGGYCGWVADSDPTPVPIGDAAAAERTQVVAMAWQCEPCGVRGRAVSGPDVVCWNCGEPATIAARPAVPVETFALAAHHRRRLMS